MSTFLNPNAIEDSSIAKSKLDTALKTEIENKQDTLTAGAGIDITDNKISCILDTTIFKVVDSLPTAPASGDENKIHLVLSSSSEEGNTYDEYLWTNNSWEKIGAFRPSVDLSDYAKTSYVDTQITSVNNKLLKNNGLYINSSLFSSDVATKENFFRYISRVYEGEVKSFENFKDFFDYLWDIQAFNTYLSLSYFDEQSEDKTPIILNTQIIGNLYSAVFQSHFGNVIHYTVIGMKRGEDDGTISTFLFQTNTILLSDIIDNKSNISKLTTNLANEAEARTQADTELQTQINGKQDALTLTVKDNGNIVLANIQGQSKEFMPATPSGDPMHYAYVTAGAEYNDTGADIVKTTPWADMIDDDYTGEYGKTVVHKAGYWYLNGLGDITNDEIRKIYQVSSNIVISDLQVLSYFSPYIPLKTMFPINATSVEWTGSLRILTNQAFFNMKKGVVFRIAPTNRVLKLRGFEGARIGIFNYSSILHCLDTIEYEGVIENDMGLSRCATIITIKITRLKYDLNISKTNALSVKSVLYMINNEAATSPITITLHANAYNRCMANADILAALQAHTNVSLASA